MGVWSWEARVVLRGPGRGGVVLGGRGGPERSWEWGMVLGGATFRLALFGLLRLLIFIL